jgi:hypothetical protein
MTMRKSLWIILTVLVVAVAAPVAHADSFTATFTCNTPCTSTPTAPDVSFPAPTFLSETWDGFSFDHFLAAGDLPTDQYTWENILTGELGSSFSIGFLLTDLTSGNASAFSQHHSGTPPPDAHDRGTLAFTAVAAPEPGSVGLILLGLGVVFMVRKRTGQGLSQAS